MLPPLNWNRTQSDSWSVKTRCTNVAKWKWVLWSTPSSWLYLGQKLLTVDRRQEVLVLNLHARLTKFLLRKMQSCMLDFFFLSQWNHWLFILFDYWTVHCALMIPRGWKLCYSKKVTALVVKESIVTILLFLHVMVVWRLQIFWKRKLN